MCHASIEKMNGEPAIQIDGQPITPMAMTAFLEKPEFGCFLSWPIPIGWIRPAVYLTMGAGGKSRVALPNSVLP